MTVQVANDLCWPGIDELDDAPIASDCEYWLERARVDGPRQAPEVLLRVRLRARMSSTSWERLDPADHLVFDARQVANRVQSADLRVFRSPESHDLQAPFN